MAWNGMSVIHAALRSVHGEETVAENLSGYYLSRYYLSLEIFWFPFP